MKMERLLRIASVIVLFCVANSQADEVVIQSIDSPGQISFSEAPNAISYRIEWAPAVYGNWTNFAGDLGKWMGTIPATGSGVITVSVPMVYRVVVMLPPAGMVYIPAGSFMMGNATNVFSESEGDVDELPQHTVHLDAFYIESREVTRSLWLSVRVTAGSLGYSFSNYLLPYPTDLPMTDLPWYDAVKWCNARTEIEGLTPVYYTDAGFTNVFRVGEINPYVDWSANGYRLPTEAEWEKTARGGLPDLRFPWSDYTNNISHEKANYEALGGNYDLSVGPHPVFYTGAARPSPVGYFASNDYNVYDMAGNAWEWCWDWYDNAYYGSSPTNNPHGAASGIMRVRRGGSYYDPGDAARCAARSGDIPPGFETLEIYDTTGFRCVRRY